ncbi:MAG: glycoside hydrolase family 97 protein [Prolixibacteraceae bacterium]
MKKVLAVLIGLLLVVFVAGAKEYSIVSPDGFVVLNVQLGDQITWSVNYQNQPAIERATVGMELSGRHLGIASHLKSKSINKIDQMIQPVVSHKDAVIHDECNELILRFKESFNLVFRAYNDGVAYQFQDLLTEPAEVMNETMNLKFPDGSSSFFPQEETMYSHNERIYLNKKLGEITKDEFCSLPVLFQTPSKINVLFTETALHNYPCMFINGNGDQSVHTKFPKYVLEAVPDVNSSPDRNEIITKEAEFIAKNDGAKTYPWRVFVITNEDKKLVESNLTVQLANRCVLENTDWIKPGRVAWDWYNANNIFGVDFEAGINDNTYKYYIDFAAENGIEYIILDEGWTKSTTEIMACNPDINVEELVKYGASKNVGIILWVLWKPLNDNTTEILETYKNWGAKGIKVDFMQRSDQGMVESYEAIAKECARLEMLVDYHGAFKPAGLEQKYPNVINYEGVKGSENNKWSHDVTPEHNVTIPFIRMVAGPLDYTPGAMVNASLENHLISHYRPMSLGTRCQQVAMYVVYEAPLQMLCENPSIYRKEQETVDFITQIPTTWDETKVLEGQVGDYIIVARRHGDKWYVGGMTDWSARTFKIDLSFLDDGAYTMEVMKDGVNADKYAQDYKKSSEQVNAKSNVEIAMAPGGGWAAILTKK